MKPIPRTVWALGLVSMFMDISSEMIHSLLPVFLVSVLHAGTLSVGLIEGAAEGLALITKTFSGALSDRIGRRKRLVFIGYAIGTITKPLFALATSIQLVFAARFLDRMGKGIRGAPRDALVADATPPQDRGAAYGLRQSLDTVGACAGPLLAALMMWVTRGDFRTVFWLALLPGLLAVATIFIGVREPKRPIAQRQPARLWRKAGRMGAPFWITVVLGAIFTLARFSEAFLLLRAQSVGLEAGMIPMILVVMNLTYALTAYPVGKQSDRVGRSGLLAWGLAILILSDIVLAQAGQIWQVVLGAALWGLHMGLTQGLLSAMVADSAEAELRGTAFGIFGLAGGMAILAANVIAGALWQAFGPQMTFLAGALFTSLTLLGYLFLQKRISRK